MDNRSWLSGREAHVLRWTARIAGLLLAWKWEGIGSILAAVSVAAFAILGLQTPARPGGILLLGVMYLVPAVVFTLSWRR